MRAAIYARKSQEQTGVADEAKSVTRQIERARACAKRKGWTVADAHIYTDEGISGAEFANRPGFVRLMASLTPKAPFDALIMSEESRLGREMIEVSFALKQIIQAGVRVFYFMEDRERTLDSPTDTILLAVNAYAGELEREMARQRSRDAALQRARGGFVTGGWCFGYRNVRTDTGRVVREVEPEEARVIVRIFELARDGKGICRIAATLNAEHALAPRPQRGRPSGWLATTVKAVLGRPVYRGQIVWGASQKRDRWGRRKQSRRPKGAWLTVDAPHLRIVSDEPWEAAHERIAASRDVYLRRTDGQLGARRRTASSPSTC